jgi:hypothetical protein
MKQLLITGLPRSGTTLLGNLLGSCNRVEYFFEPPLMSSILNNLASYVKDEIWVKIYEDYRDYELLHESIAGRRLNFNSHDDTYIHNILSETEIDKRLSKTWRSHDVESLLFDSVFCFKTPGLGKGIRHLKDKYADLKILVLIRDTPSVIKSIKLKSWFNDSSKAKIRDVIVYNDHYIPSIIPSKFYDEWVSMGEDQRIILYIYHQYRTLENLEGLIFIDFNELVSSPKYFNNLIEYLDIEPSEKTNDLLKELVPKPILRQSADVFGTYKGYFDKVESMSGNFLTKKK